jgi:hypothetical protein
VPRLINILSTPIHHSDFRNHPPFVLLLFAKRGRQFSTSQLELWNMAEPLPSASIAAADAAADNEEDPSSRLPNNAEDRKAAVALNSLNATEISQDDAGGSATKQPSKADQEALGKAMSRLEIASGAGSTKRKDEQQRAEEKKEGEVKKKVKVAVEDVLFLVRCLPSYVCRQLYGGARLMNE